MDPIINADDRRAFMWCILFWRCTSMITSADRVLLSRSQIDERFHLFLKNLKRA